MRVYLCAVYVFACVCVVVCSCVVCGIHVCLCAVARGAVWGEEGNG